MSQQLELLQENPSQWTAVSLVTPDIQKKEIKPFVILALKELEGTPDERTSSLVSAGRFAAVRAVVRHAARLRSAAGGAWAQPDLLAFLEGIRFSPECCAELAGLLSSERLYEAAPKHLRVKPALAQLAWKIDLSLSQAMLQSSREEGGADTKQILHQNTHVLLVLTLTDGRTLPLRLSVARFHELRFSVASALKGMIVMERRRAMRD